MGAWRAAKESPGHPTQQLPPLLGSLLVGTERECLWRRDGRTDGRTDGREIYIRVIPQEKEREEDEVKALG